MGNKEFTEILLEYFQKEQEHLPNNEWKQINILINDFSDNRFFSILNEEEQYRMALIISERIKIELLNDDNIFVFTAKSSEDTHFNITVQNYNFRYKITNKNHIVTPLPKRIETDISTRKEQKSFYQDLNEIYNDNKSSPWTYTIYPLVEKMNKFIEDFISESFLDKIPLVEREEIIVFIIGWGLNYYKEKEFTATGKFSQVRKRDLNKIKSFKKFITKHIPDKEVYKTQSETNVKGRYCIAEFTDYKGLIPQNVKYLEDIYSKLNILQLDLENEKFKIFSKLYYTGSNTNLKKHLGFFLETKGKKYNLTYSDDIRNINANMPNLK